MLSNQSILEIESIIEYTFKNKDILNIAFTHTSFVNENNAKSNERMEFLGDAVLDFIVADVLFCATGEDEGGLTAMRQRYVSREPLNAAVEKMDILKYYQLGRGFKNTKTLSVKFKSNLFEALLAAVYLDSRELSAPKKMIEKFLLSGQNFETEKDYKSRLQELLQSENRLNWNYITTDSNDGYFESELKIGEKSFLGRGRKKRDAEQIAAKLALSALENEK